jgi:hypothetical protein
MGWKWVKIPEDELRRLYLDEKLSPVRNRLRE